MAHDEPPHQDLRCLQIQLFSSLVVKELQTTNLRLQIFKKMLSPSHIILRNQRLDSVDLDEVAPYEPPHQDLRCLQIQLFSSLVVKELTL